jgi:hypothetical protein
MYFIGDLLENFGNILVFSVLEFIDKVMDGVIIGKRDAISSSNDWVRRELPVRMCF